jgi:hypothetical protein
MAQDEKPKETVFVNPWEKRAEIGLWSALTRSIQEILLKPSKFFSSLTSFDSYFSLCFFSTVTFWLSLLFQSTITYFRHQLGMGPNPFEKITLISGLIGVLVIGIVVPLVLSVMLFISAGLFHLFVMLFRGNGNYKGTFAVLVFSGTPYLFSPIPYVGPIVSFIWVSALFIIGLKHVHGMSTLKAVLTDLGVVLTVTGLCIILAFTSLQFMSKIRSMAASKGMRIPYKNYKRHVRPSEYRIDGISYSKDNPIVIINEKIYHINEAVAGGKIIDITEGSITVQFGEKTSSYKTGDSIWQKTESVQ